MSKAILDDMRARGLVFVAVFINEFDEVQVKVCEDVSDAQTWKEEIARANWDQAFPNDAIEDDDDFATTYFEEMSLGFDIIDAFIVRAGASV